MDGAREQRAGQGGVDPRVTALDEGARLDGSPPGTPFTWTARGRPTALARVRLRHVRVDTQTALVQAMVTHLEVATVSVISNFRSFDLG